MKFSRHRDVIDLLGTHPRTGLNGRPGKTSLSDPSKTVSRTGYEDAALKAFISDNEGLSLKPYLDSRGFLTIGYGRCLDKKGISEKEASLLLDNDLKEAWKACEQLPVFASLSVPRKHALVDMCFNLGFSGLCGFRKMLKALEQKRYAEAAAEVLDSNYARQVGPRAERIAYLIAYGQHPKSPIKR